MIQNSDELQQLRKGLLEYAVLQVIAARKVYAADILARLASTPFAAGEGTLYPLLSRLKREGRLQYDWVESEAGPPRKYYSLTIEGQERLVALGTSWQELDKALKSLSKGAKA